MIYTVTMNPAIDCTLHFSSPISAGRVNRADFESIRFGGKGINVSHVLKQFGADSIITGFCAGTTGAALSAELESEEHVCDFVRLKSGMTRINLKLASASGEGDPDTELNAPGPCPDEDDLAALAEKLSGLKEGDAAVLAGSLPSGVSSDYIRILADAVPKGVALVCDLSGDALMSVLSAKPVLVKPNVHELFDLMEIPSLPENERDLSLIADCAGKLIWRGASNVLVTMGGGGAYFTSSIGESGFIPAPAAPKMCSTAGISAVGCGDSAVAGWLCGSGLAGAAAKENALSASGVRECSGTAKTAACLAVAFGSASYYFGFPASPESVRKLV